METLTEIKETPLSNEDINIMLNGTKIFKYPDLEDMNSIDEIFDDQGRAVMLFLTKDENTGHWISLHKKENIIYYFDPYGYDVDEEKEFIPDYKLEELNQEQPFLMDLFKKSKYKVYSNQYAFQNRKGPVHLDICNDVFATEFEVNENEFLNMGKFEFSLQKTRFIFNEMIRERMEKITSCKEKIDEFLCILLL